MSFSIRTEHTLLRCTKIAIYLIPFLPLFIAPSLMFPYITGKNFAFRILVELASIFWLGLMAANQEYKLRSSGIVLSVLVFTFIVGLADIFGVNPNNSFWSNYDRMEGYITVLHLVIFFLILTSIFQTEKDWKNFFSINVIVSVFVSLFFFVEPFSVIQAANYIAEYGTRRASTIGNPPFLASYLLLSVFLGLILTFSAKSIYLKLFCLLSVIINLIVIYMTASRGAILAAFIGAMIIGTFLLLRKHGDSDKMGLKKVVFILIIALLTISLFVFLFFHNIDSIKNDKTIYRFITMFSSDSSVDSRLYAWKMAWNGIKENPVIGWGQENYIGVYSVNPIPREGKLVWMDRAHNIILDWLINAGMLGLFAYLSIYGTAFHSLWNNLRKKTISRNETIIITTAITVYFIQNLFTFDNISSYMIFFSLIAYINNLESIKKVPYSNLSDNLSRKTNRIKLVIVTLVAFIVFSLISYYLNYIPFKQLRLYTQISTSLRKYNSFSTMLNDFDRALSYGNLGDNYIRKEMVGVSEQIIKYQLYGQEGALRLIQTAAEETEKGIAAENHNLEYITDAYGFYELLAQYDPSFIPKAEALLEKCLRMNPQYSKFELNRVDLYFLKKDYESAYITLKEFVDQHPDNEAAYFKLALAAILTHKKDEMGQALQKVENLRLANNKDVASGIEPVFNIKRLNMLAQSNMEARNYKHALKYYEEILSVLSTPKDIWLFRDAIQPLSEEDKMHMKAKLHLEIAGIYKLLNDKENAEMEARKAIEIDPEDISSSAMQFIDLLKK
jgi:putative inorganic carbon (HCO3(-)) transporter